MDSFRKKRRTISMKLECFLQFIMQMENGKEALLGILVVSSLATKN